MKHHLITLLFVLGAVVCFFVGFGEGILPLMAAYVAFEVVLAVRLSRGLRRRGRIEQA